MTVRRRRERSCASPDELRRSAFPADDHGTRLARRSFRGKGVVRPGGGEEKRHHQKALGPGQNIVGDAGSYGRGCTGSVDPPFRAHLSRARAENDMVDLVFGLMDVFRDPRPRLEPNEKTTRWHRRCRKLSE